jgi:aminoglycoside phosphotransferase (APT) family kinase protein
MGTSEAKFKESMTTIVSRYFGCPVEIEELHRLSGGAVAESWWFDAITEDNRYELILRLARNSKQIMTIYPDKETEAKIQMVTIDRGVPVPKVYFVLHEEDGIGRGYVMQRIAGETIPKKILRDEKYASARDIMAHQAGEILFKIHSVDTKLLPELTVLSNARQLEDQHSIYEEIGERHPMFDYAFRFLRENLPEDTEPSLVHSDFRNGNLIVGSEGIRTVLDWEMAHLGDPMEYLGWICVNSWRFGNIDKPVGGFGNREDLYAGYEAAGGKVDEQRVHYWEVFGTLKWGIICLIQAFTHLSGTVRSVELAAIGRRVSETELDLVHMLT